ncbi:putative phage tail assembly chaperone [Pseudomonas sp. URMO17WK12:I2]|uniref:putative phage tail assembly chaperone n=1 Tax=Pseudomonas sp. URMO17WK12:I2 TaxID=1261623 RepID=UPI000DADEA1B|nr:putative phage tail assembly chaperone [Pseudomonas sp. URMO17WK12:I2]PZW49702.1 tail assembly chaperone [Pseudomonas sp. URMO17WK12:I2]
MTASRTIDLEIGETEFSFNLTAQDVTKYFNAMTPTNKVAPAHNLLTGTVKADQKDALRPLLANPLMVMQLAGVLLEDYAPDVEVTVKKRSTTPND